MAVQHIIDDINGSYFDSEAFTAGRPAFEIAYYADPIRRTDRAARTFVLGALLRLYIPDPFEVAVSGTYITVPCDGDVARDQLLELMDVELWYRGRCYRFSGFEAVLEQRGEDHVRGVQFIWTVVTA